MAPRKITLKVQPGVLTSQSDYASAGRYIDMDKVRFDEGLPEKIGGWNATGWDAVTGRPRSAIAWQTIAGNRYIAQGSALKVETIDDDGTATNITPVRASGTLGSDPFTTTSGEVEVTVDDTAHGCEENDFVTFGGASAVGGITIDGEYQVTRVVDANSFIITHSSAASSSATGGGASVTYSYDINVGEVSTVFGGGYGVGTYGTGTWGTERTGGNYLILSATWSFDTYGEDLIAMRNNNGALYQWDTSVGGRMAAVSNAPTGNYQFITSERIIVVLGADSNPMRVRGCDDEDNTVWTASATNKAFGRTLQSGSRLMAGARLAQGVNILWSDSTAYSMQWANNNVTVYSTRLIGEGEDLGLIGAAAFVVVGGVAFWMSASDFKMYAGSPQRIPNVDDIRDFVFDDLNRTQANKIQCRYNPLHHEIWWHYPSSDANENDRYVAFSVTEGTWIKGTMARTAFVNQSEQASSIYAFDEDGTSYQHEVGVDDNGSSMPWYIETGYSDLEEGNENMDVFGFIADFKRRSGDVTLTLTSIDYPDDSGVTETYVKTIAENEGMSDVRMAGRAVKYRLAGDGVGSDFRLGRVRAEINEAGGRR